MSSAIGSGPRAAPDGALRTSRHAMLEYLVVAAIFVVVTAVAALAFWPGRMNADTLVEIDQMRRNSFSDQHAPILQALWRPLFINGFGPGWVLTGQTLTFLVGTWLIFRLTFRRIPAAVVASLVTLTPPTFGSIGLIGRDVWFLCFLMLAFGLAALAYRTHERKRMLSSVGVIVAAWFALAARQNAAAGVVVPIVMLLFILLAAWRGDRWRAAGLVVRAVVAGVLLTLVLMATQAVIRRALDVQPAYPAAALYVYDLAMLSQQDRENLFPASVVRRRDIAVIDQHADPDTIIPMLAGPDHPVTYPFTKDDARALGKAWRSALTSDPLGYLRERTELFLRQIAVTRNALWTYHIGIDANPWGYRTEFPWANDIANDYQGVFADDANNGTVFYSVWIYLLICVAAIAVCLRRRTAVRLFVAAIALTAVLYQVGIFFGAMGVIFRFEYPSVVIAIVVIAFGLQRAWQLARARLRTSGGVPAPTPR